MTPDNISGFFLEAHGWIKTGDSYSRGNDTVVFDGANWWLNGNKIIDSISGNVNLKTTKFDIPGFKDEKDYYERLMENK